MFSLDFYRGKRVFVTGHTGFKGSWLCRILVNAGAIVTGYSLEPPTEPNLFSLAGLEGRMTSIIGDIRDMDKLLDAFNEAQPEIVFHLAAQPIVRDSYKMPRYTYETNVMGTVNVLECCRISDTVKSVLNVTTDKVYLNNEWAWGYRENEPLDGYDPYSNSKSCSELVTHSYKRSFFDGKIAVSTARAGNVIGGGDFSNDRIIPDCVRAVKDGRVIGVRNPYSTRPYQHVLEPLFAYMMIAERQFEEMSYAGYYNVGPDDCDCVTTGELVDLFCKKWGEGAKWENRAEENAPHEANFLKLDCSKLKAIFEWAPNWHIDKTMQMICDWTKVWLSGGDISVEMDREIKLFLEDFNG
ncbi:MAG: CDP-glucose 4,6-dehydratase [Oscillospiraceae bacterium]|nr:CDP-glucose 4,6-dehydratase [Oscillospiraceae bacterium]